MGVQRRFHLLVLRQFPSELRNNTVIMQPLPFGAALPHEPLISVTLSKVSQCATETRPGLNPRPGAAAAAATVRLRPL